MASLLLVFALLLTGCTGQPTNVSPDRSLDLKLPEAQHLAAELPLAWRQATAQLLNVSWVRGPDGAGYVEPPPMTTGEVTKQKLYTSAWTSALLHQAGLQPDPRQMAAMRGWLDNLVRSDFTFSDGYPPLHNLYLYSLLQTSLGQPLDRSASLRTLLKLRKPNGLYSWEENGKAELTATQIATELLVTLKAESEILAPTRKAILKLLSEGRWLEAEDPKEALLDVGGPLLLSAHNLGLPLDAQAKTFVDKWTRQLQTPTSTSPLMVEILLQLARLNQAIDQPFTLSSEYLEQLQSLRTAVGGFSPEPDLELEPQYTYKVQQLLQLAADIPPRPEAARHAAVRFWCDSWVAYMKTRPTAIDTYHGLMVARFLGEPVPDEAAVANFLANRLRAISATQPSTEELARAAQELSYVLRARELLTHPFPLPDGITTWVETALNQVISAGTATEISTLSFLTEAAAYLGIAVDRKEVEAALQKASYRKDKFLDVAVAITRAARSLGLPADTFRQHPAVQTVLSLTPISGGYRAATDAPVPDLFSTFKVVEVLQFFAPEQATTVLPAVRDFVRSLQAPVGGFRVLPGQSPMLRSTALGLLLLGM
ncbi:MAG TPA: hypothetical protein VIK75_09550 [Calditerricola sp.]